MDIIGLDFGNFNSYPSYINNFDPNTRLSGLPRSLFPTTRQYRNGIPSVFFKSPTGDEWVGVDAIKPNARPLSNRLRYLKRTMGQNIMVKDSSHNKTIPVDIDYAITAVIEHCMRIANNEMEINFQRTTNLISLAYPASFTTAQRQHLIDLAQKATLADGTHVKVAGTIAEPAAAALDYLSDEQTDSSDTTVLTYDLGGGTFDIALVSAYPNGKINAQNKTTYYDIIDTDGLPNVGGREFDDVMFKILERQIPVELSETKKHKLLEEAIQAKEYLTTSQTGVVEVVFEVGEEEYYLKATREEFDNEAHSLLMKTLTLTRNFIDRHPNQKPAVIVLSGAASQMPMVADGLKEILPEYADKIKLFRPEMAISYGAARFGTAESNDDPYTSTVQKRVEHDLGIFYYEDHDYSKPFIYTCFKAGTPLPASPVISESSTIDYATSSQIAIYEAKHADPDVHNINDDWTYIMEVDIVYGETVPPRTPCVAEVSIDDLGVLNLVARDARYSDSKTFQNSITLKHLS